jgi:hypothetical protein
MQKYVKAHQRVRKYVKVGKSTKSAQKHVKAHDDNFFCLLKFCDDFFQPFFNDMFCLLCKKIAAIKNNLSQPYVFEKTIQEISNQVNTH